MSNGLIPRQVNDLAPVAQALIWAAPGPWNISGFELAHKFLNDLSANISSYEGMPILDIVRKATRNETLTMDRATVVLTGITKLPGGYWPGLAGIWGFMIAFSTPMMFLRIYSRWRLSGGLKRDDWFLIIGWLIATGNNIEDMYLAIAHNWGAHGWNITREGMYYHYKIGAVDGWLFSISSWFFKMSLIITFHDIYPHKKFRIVAWTIAIILTAQCASILGYLLKRCTPIDKWNHVFETTCIPTALYWARVLTIFNILVDFLIFFLPCYIFLRIKTSFKQKILAGGLMGVGLVVCLAAVMRFTTFRYWIFNTDATWRSIPLTHWTLAELHIGVFCACLPAVRKLWVHWSPRVKSMLPGRSSNQNASSLYSDEKGSKDDSSGENHNQRGPVRSFGFGPINRHKKPVGDLTAIMNMGRTDLESGVLGTVMERGESREEKSELDSKVTPTSISTRDTTKT